mmetsp:Transcript_12259/g.30927  ORF Transcript_12259/g.30927 Transcript_12259/m.30927 type:complete len:354 (+) Transcript_12259:119-1180(+)
MPADTANQGLPRSATFERIQPGDLQFLAPGSQSKNSPSKPVDGPGALFAVQPPGNWRLDAFNIIHNAVRLECGLAARVADALRGFDSNDEADVKSVNENFSAALAKWVELFLKFLKKAIENEELAIQAWFVQAYDPTEEPEEDDGLYMKFLDLKAMNSLLEYKLTQHGKTLNLAVATVQNMASSSDHSKPQMVSQVGKFILSMVSLFHKYLPRSEKLILQLADEKASEEIMEQLGDTILEEFRNDKSQQRKTKMQLLIRWMIMRKDMKKYCDAHLKASEVEESDIAANAHWEFEKKVLARDFPGPKLARGLSRGGTGGSSGSGGKPGSRNGSGGKNSISNFIRTISGKKPQKE